MVFELLTGKLEVETAHENLAFRVGEFHSVLRITATDIIFLNNLAVWVRFLNLLPIVAYHKVIIMVMAAVMVVTDATVSSICATLVIVG